LRPSAPCAARQPTEAAAQWQGTDESVGRVKAAYARLVALKNKYDPENLFRLNQTIEPTANE